MFQATDKVMLENSNRYTLHSETTTHFDRAWNRLNQSLPNWAVMIFLGGSEVV